MTEEVPDVDPDEQLPPEGVLGNWEAVVADLEATAEEYRENGWTVVEAHPGDVTALSGQHEHVDEFGLDVLVPGDEAERIQAHVSAPDAAFDSCSVFRAVVEGVVFLVVAVEDEAREIAVLYPAYYDADEERAQDMLEVATREGEMRTHVRDLAEEEVSTFTHDDPELFAPPAEE